MTRRLVALATVAAAAALTLTGCTKPNPGVSVVSGTNSAQEEALCWAWDNAAIDPKTCAGDVLAKAVDAGKIPTVAVAPGDTIGISVDPVVAEAGWVPLLGTTEIAPGPIHTNYLRFTVPSLADLGASPKRLAVVALSGQQLRGAWAFDIVPAAA